jgi:hypothetical protein
MKHFVRKKKKKMEENQSITSHIDNSMPIEFADKHWLHIMWTKLVNENGNNNLFSLLLGRNLTFTSNYFHSFRALELIIRVMLVFFSNTLIAQFYFADDGTCEGIISKAECLSEVSFDGVMSSCTWNESEEYCSFKDIEIIPQNICLIAFVNCLFVIVFAKPFKVLLRYLARALASGKRHIHDLHRETKSDFISKYSGNNSSLSYHIRHKSRRDMHWGLQPSVMMLAARYQLMQTEIDFLSPKKELHSLLRYKSLDLYWVISSTASSLESIYAIKQLKEKVIDRIIYTFTEHLGDPKFAARFIHYLKAGILSNGYGIMQITRARKRAKRLQKMIEKNLILRENVSSKLVSVFIEEHFQGLKRSIVSFYLSSFLVEETSQYRPISSVMIFLSFLFIIVFLVFIGIFTIYYGKFIGSRGISLWMYGVIGAVYLDLAVIPPLNVWVFSVFIPSIVKQEVVHFQVRSVASHLHIIYYLFMTSHL